MHASRIGFKDIDDFFVAVAPELSYPPSPHCGHSYIILVDVYKTNNILTFLLEKSVVGSRWLQMSKNCSKWLQMGSRWAPGGLQIALQEELFKGHALYQQTPDQPQSGRYLIIIIIIIIQI